MDLYIYSDESGVFDKEHNKYFIYGGLIFLGKNQKDVFARKYSAAERVLRKKYKKDYELKACKITNNEKGKLYRSMNNAIKFGIIIKQTDILDRIFQSKKDKQRYLDYAYKIGLKNALKNLVNDSDCLITQDNIENIYIYNDEHSTATNGRYELREGLEQEFKHGTYNDKYEKFFPPLFTSLKGLSVHFCNSKKILLIRASDIIANHIYHEAITANNINELYHLPNIYITILP